MFQIIMLRLKGVKLDEILNRLRITISAGEDCMLDCHEQPAQISIVLENIFLYWNLKASLILLNFLLVI